MNNQRPYGHAPARPANPAGPTIRAGLSVQELKAMTAMRVAHDHDPNKQGMAHEGPGVFRNPASSYQTATPQQLQAAGIQPVVVNDRHAHRHKGSNYNTFQYTPNTQYPEPHAHGHNRSYTYDESLSAGSHSHLAAAPLAVRGSSDSSAMTTSSYARASSTAGHVLSTTMHPPVGAPSRTTAPQVNSVEDVKELTRLRMLMSERDAFFEGPSGRGDPAGALGLGLPSNDSYDAYDFHQGGLSLDDPSLAPSPHLGGALSASQKPPLFAPPSQQQAFDINPRATGAPQGYGKAGTLAQSASLSGLGVRGNGLGGAAPSPVGSVHSYGSSTNSPYLAPQGLAGGTVRPGLHNGPSPLGGQHAHSSSSLALNGSALLGGRRVGQSDRPLAPLGGPALGNGLYGSPYQQGLPNRGELDGGLGHEPPRAGRGIERDLMLNSQFSQGHGLSGGFDHMERSVNGHGHHAQTPIQGGLHTRGLFDDDTQQRSFMLNQPDPFAPGRALGSIGLGNGGQRNDLGLNCLLGEPASFRGLGHDSHVGGRPDTLLDMLAREGGLGGLQSQAPPSRLPASSTAAPALGSLTGLAPLQQPASHSHKVVLGPLATATSPVAPASQLSPALTLSARRSLSPVTLAPLSSSPEKGGPEKMVAPANSASQVRKLSMVPKAATFNAMETKKATLPEATGQSPSTSGKGPASSPPRRMEAFAEKSDSIRLDGIASPSADDGDDAAAQLSPSPHGRRFPMIKASTTSRLPVETVSSALSPKLLIMKNKMAGSSGTTTAEATPPPHTSVLERQGTSDSAGMNYLASEMAEMVLDTPAQPKATSQHSLSSHYFPWDDRDYSGHLDDLLSRDNSNDLGRILGAMSGSQDDSGHSLSGPGLFKRTNSISFNE